MIKRLLGLAVLGLLAGCGGGEHYGTTEPPMNREVTYQSDSFGTVSEANVYIVTPYIGPLAGFPFMLTPGSPKVTAATQYGDSYFHKGSTRITVQYWHYEMITADRQMLKEVNLTVPDDQSEFHISYD